MQVVIIVEVVLVAVVTYGDDDCGGDVGSSDESHGVIMVVITPWFW